MRLVLGLSESKKPEIPYLSAHTFSRTHILVSGSFTAFLENPDTNESGLATA